MTTSMMTWLIFRRTMHIPPHYATREYIEQLDGTTIIEYDHLEVDESDLDALGRIEVRED